MSRFGVRDWKKQGLHQGGQDAVVSSPTDNFAKGTVEHSDPDSIQALAAQLREAMARKGWSIGETARQASQYLAEGQHMGWHYMWGHALPPSPLESPRAGLGTAALLALLPIRADLTT